MSEAIKWAELTLVQRDRLVAEKVMDWQERPCGAKFGAKITVKPGGNWECPVCGLKGAWSEVEQFQEHLALPPRYTTSMNAAWLVVEHFRKKSFDVHVASAPFQYDVLIASRRWEWKRFEASAESASEAICIAALRACGIEIVV